MLRGNLDHLTPELMRAMVGALTEGIIVVDSAGQHLFANRPGLVEIGYVDEDLPQRSEEIVALWPNGSPMLAEERPSLRAFAGETVLNERLIHRGPRGDRLIDVSAIPLAADPETGNARALIVFHDVTDEHRLRAELRSFSRVVAHDLQSPLTGIRWWLELIADEIKDGRDLPHESASTTVDRLSTAVVRMSRLISDLLTHAMSGDSELERLRVDLGEVVRRIVENRAAQDFVTVGPLPKVDADPVLITQAFDNLINNALKYVEPGSKPRVTVSAVEDGDYVCVCVADEGIGIADDELDAIFDEFHRGRAAEYDGTGLGLSIVKRAVIRHGGSVRARPNSGGKGLVIEVRLPAS